MFVDTFIRRPILASVCSLVIILAGLIAIPTLPIAQFPELAPPQVQVVAFYNGANAETVETTVTTPLEQAINGIEGMQYMSSTSGKDGAFADNGQYDAQFISNYVDRFIRDEIKRVPGVGDVVVIGERRYAMRLWLDPDRLASRGLTAGDVVEALREQNTQVAAGQVGQAPAPAGQTYQISVHAAGRL